MRSWMIALALAAGYGLGCGGACGEPTGLMVTGAPPGEVVVSWDDSNAMGLYVTDPDAWVPDGPRKMVDGYSYWVVESTSFPGGFEAPVVYGHLPHDGKDATEAHGGMAGGEPLECGVPYKVTVVSLGGTDETFAEWECP